jgi:hypothetical protein
LLDPINEFWDLQSLSPVEWDGQLHGVDHPIEEHHTDSQMSVIGPKTISSVCSVNNAAEWVVLSNHRPHGRMNWVNCIAHPKREQD